MQAGPELSGGLGACLAMQFQSLDFGEKLEATQLHFRVPACLVLIPIGAREWVLEFL